MGKLYIFGNGLDLHYKLKTKLSDFVNILKDKDIYNETNNAAEIFENYNVLWSNFEQDMAYIELEQIEENQVQSPDYMSEHEYDRDGVITNVEEYVDSLKRAIFESLSDMIHTAEQDIA
ncbi:AbiH family protein [uncultured Clostridium sp.]|uniref:AbiH family protein n=1 Tax=uncultured Clostridium sp. TaxID=59620 RepID=UPI0025E6F7F6|nr:AbiH family protein [uncultured Clostridium sp.]